MYNQLGHRHQCLCCSLKCKDFEPDNRQTCVKADYSLNHVIAYKGKTGTLPDKGSLKSSRQIHSTFYFYYMSNAIAYLMLKSLVSFPVHGRVMDQGRASQWTLETATPSHTPTWAPSRMGSDTSTRQWESTEWPLQLRTAWGSRQRFFSYMLHVSECFHARIFTRFLTKCLYVS